MVSWRRWSNHSGGWSSSRPIATACQVVQHAVESFAADELHGVVAVALGEVLGQSFDGISVPAGGNHVLNPSSRIAEGS
jgi:hypothetical protein